MDQFIFKPGRSEFSSPRTFQRWSQKCRNPSGSLVNYFFVGSYWTSNPAVYLDVKLCSASISLAHERTKADGDFTNSQFSACPWFLVLFLVHTYLLFLCLPQRNMVENRGISKWATTETCQSLMFAMHANFLRYASSHDYKRQHTSVWSEVSVDQGRL